MVSNHSLLLRIQGSDPSLQPYMLCAHVDVVPADPERWSRPPFAGDIADGYIWGRGALDAKDILMVRCFLSRSIIISWLNCIIYNHPVILLEVATIPFLLLQYYYSKITVSVQAS